MNFSLYFTVPRTTSQWKQRKKKKSDINSGFVCRIRQYKRNEYFPQNILWPLFILLSWYMFSLFRTFRARVFFFFSLFEWSPISFRTRDLSTGGDSSDIPGFHLITRVVRELRAIFLIPRRRRTLPSYRQFLRKKRVSFSELSASCNEQRSSILSNRVYILFVA